MTQRWLTFVLAILACPAVGLAAAEDIAMPSTPAVLLFPSSGATSVPSNTALRVDAATRVEVVAEDGTRIPCVQSDSRGRVVPERNLPAGLATVEAEPVDYATNWVGYGVMVELGTFTVAEGIDGRAPVVESAEARYIEASDTLRVTASISGLWQDEPVALDIDVGDAASPPDGVPDLSSGFSWEHVYAAPYGLLMERFDVDTAVVRVRAIDMAGNEGEWSVEQPVEVVQAPGASGCHIAPTGARASGWFVLPALLLVLARSRRRQTPA